MRRLIVLLVISGLGLGACGGSGGSSATGKDSRYCQLSANLGQSFKPADVPSADSFKKADAAIGKIQAAAPSAIKADVDYLVGLVRQFERAVKANNYQVDPSFLTPFSDPKVTQAGKHLSDYHDQTCATTSTT